MRGPGSSGSLATASRSASASGPAPIRPTATPRKASTASAAPSTRSIDFASDRSPLQKLELELKHISQGEANAEGVARSLSRRHDSRSKRSSTSPNTSTPTRKSRSGGTATGEDTSEYRDSRRHHHLHLGMPHLGGHSEQPEQEYDEVDRKDYYTTRSDAENLDEPQVPHRVPPTNPSGPETQRVLDELHPHSHRNRRKDRGFSHIARPTGEDVGETFTQRFCRLTLEDRDAEGAQDYDDLNEGTGRDNFHQGFSSEKAFQFPSNMFPEAMAFPSFDGAGDDPQASSIPERSRSHHGDQEHQSKHHLHHEHDPEHPSHHHHPDHLQAPHTKEEREDALIMSYIRAISPRVAQAPDTFTPPLSVKCGPLLRYTGLRRDDAPAGSRGGSRETWRGSIMIVTTDTESDYSTTPSVRLSYVNAETSSDDVQDSTPAKGRRGQKSIGRFKEVEALKLHAEHGITFWRFNMEVELSESESKIAYRINNGPAIFFWVPAIGQTMNIMFHSCNGFSLSVNPADFNGPDPLWKDVLNRHAEKPFHVMLGGGDQIYNDAVSKQTTHFRNWISIKTPFQKSATEFSSEMAEELEDFYRERYSMWFSQGLFGVANAQIPMVNIWDDHDIIDGFGSYPNHFNRCPVFTGLGAVAFKYYMLFQHQSVIQEKESDEPSWLLGAAPGPYITELSRSTFMFLGRAVAFLGLDCRTERMRDLVLSGATYEKVFARLRKEVVPGETKHLIVLLGVPIAYPRLVWLENLLTSRIMDPIKALSRRGLLGGFINNFDGGVELLDDLDDHWTAKNHKAERNWLIKRFQAFAEEHSIRITILGGDVHLAGIGQFYSNPKLNILKVNDHRYMPNVISSAIVNTPPPNTMADVLNKRNKIHHLNVDTDEDMFPIFTHDVDGKPRNNKRLLPRRNYCIISPHVPGEENAELQERTTRKSTFGKLKKARTKNVPVSDLSKEGGLDGMAGSTLNLDPEELMCDGLQITLQVEIDQKNPDGATRPYRFAVPALRTHE